MLQPMAAAVAACPCAVAVGEQQRELVRGVERGQRVLEVDHSDVAGVGVGLAALSPTGVA